MNWYILLIYITFPPISRYISFRPALANILKETLFGINKDGRDDCMPILQYTVEQIAYFKLIYYIKTVCLPV